MKINSNTNLNKQFELIWNSFVKHIVNEFQRKYRLDLSTIKKTRKFRYYIENIIQESLALWDDEETYQGIFLSSLQKKFPSVAVQFYEQLSSLRLKSQYTPVAYWSKVELSCLLGGLAISILILLWGQNTNQLIVASFNFKQGLLAIIFIYVFYRTIKQIRDNRIDNQIELNAQKLNDDLQQHYDILSNIIRLTKHKDCVDEIQR